MKFIRFIFVDVIVLASVFPAAAESWLSNSYSVNGSWISATSELRVVSHLDLVRAHSRLVKNHGIGSYGTTRFDEGEGLPFNFWGHLWNSARCLAVSRVIKSVNHIPSMVRAKIQFESIMQRFNAK